MRVLLGVTGGIAAYKSADLVRRLVKAGCTVQVIMTAGAKAFVTPLTFQALSGHAVRDAILDPAAEMGMGHIELARWAEAILIAPASANSIARLAAGMADDLLTTVVLASRAPLWVAPAMNQVMWENPLVRRNLTTLCEGRGDVTVLGPAEGEQACGDVGPGRMLEPEDIVAAVCAGLQVCRPALLATSGTARSDVARPDAARPNQTRADATSAEISAPGEQGSLTGLRMVITSGPTRERLDPVRYLSNDSSGRMGFALAAAAARRGAHVTLVAGPVQLATPAGVERVDVESARDMQAAVMSAVGGGCDLFIGAAAVADYRPALMQPHKIKKADGAALQLILEENPDIIAGVAALPVPPFTVGFAAETRDLEYHARSKLERKSLDMVIGNDVSRRDIGFNSDYNEVLVVTRNGCRGLPRQLKVDLADALIGQIALEYARHRAG